MAIDTLAELKTAITNWSKRADLASYLDDIIEMAEKRLFREVRTRDMETALNVTVSSGVATIPTDFVELKYAYVDGSPTRALKVRPSRWIIENYPVRSSDGKPFYIGVDGANFIFGPYPDSGYTIKGTYFKRLESIATSANALFVDSPDLYLFASLAELEPFLKNDKRVQLWEAKYAQIRDQVNAEAKYDLYGGDALAVSVA
jgi:hypothetical protein